MAYRTGTYVAFDGLNQTDPAKSDFRHYAAIKAWTKNRNIDFKFVDSHEKTYAVRDSSRQATLKSRIQERLRASKNMIVILSDQTRESGSMLTYEIEQAVDVYGLPLIAVYPGYRVVTQITPLAVRWPAALTIRVQNRTARAIHVAFAKDPILAAIGQFSVNAELPRTAMSCYRATAYRDWGLLKLMERDGNYRRS